MGTFGEYTGRGIIPEEKKSLFVKQMLKLLHVGGMMKIEEINMFGHKFWLLNPVDGAQTGTVPFYYNYFEDDSWEGAEFDTIGLGLFSGKIGYSEFNDAIMAAYSLYEVYDEMPGVPEIDRDAINTGRYLRWINCVLGTEFSFENRLSNLWNVAERYVLENDYDEWGINYNKLMSLIPEQYRYAVCGTDFSDLLYIVEGTDSLCEEDVKEGSYPYDVFTCKKVLKKFLLSSEKKGMKQLQQLLKKEYSARKSEKKNELKELAEMTLFLPARVFLYLAAEMKEVEFWPLWKDIKEDVYKDEIRKQYANQELEAWRRQKRKEPLPPLSTEKFLGNNRKELQDKDRLYWWDGTPEVEIDDETNKWLDELSKKHKKIVQEKGESLESETFLKDYITLFADLCNSEMRVIPFQSMFYEFIQNCKDKTYLAAIELFKEMASVEEKDIDVKKTIKRYLSVLANRDLRKKYFDF